MNVSCSHCGKAYVLPAGSAAPGIKLRVKCKACTQVFEVTPEMIEEAQKVGDESLAAVPDSGPAAPSDPNSIGEVTRHFINQSGANKRNPPWKIALFVIGAVGLPVGVLALLSTFHVVGVTVVNEQGEEVQQSFFSAEGMNGLGDVLSGKAAQKRAEAKARAEARRRQVAAPGPLDGARVGGTDLDLGSRKGSGAGEAAKMGGVTGSLGAFYGDTEKKDRGPKVRAGDDNTAKAHAGGLDEGEAAKVVAHSQMAFQDCIESGLRRNPHLKVGKVAMAVTVTPSGAVKSSAIVPKVHETSDWGACLMQRAKRMVFPPFDGDEEAEIQVPLVVGVSL
ncbi:MAG: AgmX/PglI C-terminal domain-containing protein [Archangiaceae bacterium]|nr:AgmX/PglI C-terminal domain-containing protein [Archangiaceae bacterium]